MLQLSFAQFKAGSYIIVEGKFNADFFHIVQKGHVRCFKSSSAGTGTMCGPGDFLGVVSCMSGHTQIETAVAVTDVTCISVRKDQYPELIAKNTALALKIIKSFASRMRQMNEMLTQATLNNVVSDTNEHIFEVAQYYEKIGKLDAAVFAYYQFLKTRPTGENAEVAKRKFAHLKPLTHAVFFEPTADMSRDYPEDTMIFSESQSGAEMYIIQSGQVSITKVVDGNEVTLAVLKAGDMFGEMALLENKPRSASAIAHADCHLLVVNRRNFDQMVTTQPQLISKLTTTLAERLWSMYRQLDNANIQSPVQKMVDMLSLQMEKQKISANRVGVEWATDFSIRELATLCGIPQELQPKAVYDFQEQVKFIKVVSGTIVVKDCLEVQKSSEIYRKQAGRSAK